MKQSEDCEGNRYAAVKNSKMWFDQGCFIEKIMIKKEFTEAEIDRIIGMAWEDRTTFDVIEAQFDINESEVIKIMRKNMKLSSFKMWRERVHGRKTKHRALAEEKINRFVSPDQRHRDRTF